MAKRESQWMFVLLLLVVVVTNVLLDVRPCMATTLTELIEKRRNIASSLEVVKDQLTQVAASKRSLLGMRDASAVVMTDSSFVSYALSDVIGVKSISDNQIQVLNDHENDLTLRTKVLEKSLELMDMEIANAYKNYPAPVKRYAAGSYGISVINRNGTLQYWGYYHTSYGMGFTDPTLANGVSISEPRNVDTSPMGPQAITEVHVVRDRGFLVRTENNTLYAWGDNTNGMLGG